MKINREGIEHATKQTYLEYLKLFPVLKKERNQQYGMLIITFLTMTFFGLFAINPTLTTIAELHRKLDDAKFTDRVLTQKIKALSDLQNKYSQLAPDLETIESGVPPTVNATKFIGQLHSIVSQTSVTLTHISFGSVKISSDPPVKEGAFSFTMTVEGTYSQIDAFLQKLTNFDRIVVLDSISILKSEAGGSKIGITVTGNAHYKE